MKCCGNEIVTAFCPDCGKPFKGEPLIEILSHVKGLLNRDKCAKKRRDEWDKKNPNMLSDRRIIENRAALERKIAKHERWVKSMENVINK